MSLPNDEIAHSRTRTESQNFTQRSRGLMKISKLNVSFFSPYSKNGAKLAFWHINLGILNG
jgi:hypothetical protein